MSLPYGMSPEELLDVCGPSWAGMSLERRAAYGPEFEPAPAIFTVDTIADLVTLAMRYPQAMQAEGCGVVARRLLQPMAVVELADLVDVDDGGVVHVAPAARTATSARSESARRRPAAWERDLAIATDAGEVP